MDKIFKQSYKLGMTQEKEEILGLYDFVKKLEPYNIMEIGTKLGGTFNLWCNLANMNGKKISIDLPGGEHGGWMLKDHPYLGNVYEQRNKYFESNFDNVHMITGDSHSTEVALEVSQILETDKLDFLFIDGDHTYEGILSDYVNYSNYVKKGGYIAFHDINDTEHHRKINVNVAKLWNQLKGEKTEFNNHTHWAGIGVIRHE